MLLLLQKQTPFRHLGAAVSKPRSDSGSDSDNGSLRADAYILYELNSGNTSVCTQAMITVYSKKAGFFYFHFQNIFSSGNLFTRGVFSASS